MSQRDDIIAGRYRLLDRIGTGGMGFVWRARDERLGRDVAVKQLHTRLGAGEAEAAVGHERAMREARITARLHHPHAVPVFDVVEHHGQPCLIMQYFPSRSLQEILGERRTLPPAEVARVGSEVASALASAHRVGIVHRDVKPANVLIAKDGTAKISDFGIAHAMGDVSLTSTGMVTGTPAYLAPEVARGAESSPASDVFSLGATLYAALEGRPPFGNHENPMALLHQVASGTITPPSQAGPLTPLLLAMLAAEPGDRPAMDEVVGVLRQPVEKMADVAAATLVIPQATERMPLPEATAEPAAVTEPADVPVPATATMPVATPPASGQPPAPRVSGRPPAGPPAADLLASAGERRPDPVRHVDNGRARRRAVLVAVIAVAAVAALVFAFTSLRGDAPTAAQSGADSPSTSSSSTPRPSSSVPTTRPTTSAPEPSPSSPETTPPPVSGPPTAKELAEAVENYYDVLPDDLDAGWALLTERYQRTTAKNRQTYAAFWGAIDEVDVADAKGSSPRSVTATVTYSFKDGRVFVEQHTYELKEEDGVLRIDRSKVESSRQE